MNNSLEKINEPYKISVIVTVYNVEKYMETCILSIVNQTYVNLEIILVNYGSTDNSGNICDEISKFDDRVRVLHTENCDLSSARNTGVDIATGDYITFMDCNDDFIHPQTYKSAIECFEKHLEIDLVEWEYEYFNKLYNKDIENNFKNIKIKNVEIHDTKSNYSDLNFETIKNKDYSITEQEDYIISNIKYEKHYHVAWNKLFKRSLIKDSRFIVGKIHEDAVFFNEYMLKVEKVAHIDERLYFYVKRKLGISKQKLSIKSVGGSEGFYNRHLLLSKHYPQLLLLDFRCALYRIMSHMRKIVKGNYDLDKTIRSEYVKTMLKYFDYVMTTDQIPNELKDDFHLAKSDVFNYIDKHENDIINELIGNHISNKNSFSCDNPKVSVIIPIYNVQEYLSECLISVINQSLIDIEMVCIDDGSTDNSLKILKIFAETDKRIKIIEQENKGAGQARNLGIDSAKGEFVIFIDPDDYYPNNFVLEHLYTSATNNKVLIAGGSMSKDDNGIISTEFVKKEKGYTFPSNGIIRYVDYQFDFGFQRFLYNRDMLVNNNIYFPSYRRYEDPVFLLKAMVCAKQFYALKEVVYRYRVGYKQVEWNEEKVIDLASSISEILKITSENNLEYLHALTVHRVDFERADVFCKNFRTR